MVMEDATSNINSPTLRTTTLPTLPTLTTLPTSPIIPTPTATSEAVEGSLESVDSFEDLKVYVWELTYCSIFKMKKNELYLIF